MIILFTNIKGGVGKTSTCALFAQYLYECGYPVMALDADIQASLSRHRERELAANPDVVVSWDVSTIDTTDRQSLQLSIEEAKKFEGIVLIDLETVEFHLYQTVCRGSLLVGALPED